MLYTATAHDGDAIARVIAREDLWELQQDVADYAADELDRHYAGRDWTGRGAQRDKAMHEAFSLGEGCEQVGPLPNGVTITLGSDDR